MKVRNILVVTAAAFLVQFSISAMAQTPVEATPTPETQPTVESPTSRGQTHRRKFQLSHHRLRPPRPPRPKRRQGESSSFARAA